MSTDIPILMKHFAIPSLYTITTIMYWHSISWRMPSSLHHKDSFCRIRNNQTLQVCQRFASNSVYCILS